MLPTYDVWIQLIMTFHEFSTVTGTANLGIWNSGSRDFDQISALSYRTDVSSRFAGKEISIRLLRGGPRDDQSRSIAVIGKGT